MNPCAEILRAAAFAAEKHSKQRRKDPDCSPYINHPIALANVLANEGHVHDNAVLCAALLHDTVEDTETSEDELREIFGEKIARIVLNSSPAHWERSRKQEYFDWSAQVIAGVRGTHAGLEAIFDGLYAQREML